QEPSLVLIADQSQVAMVFLATLAPAEAVNNLLGLAKERADAVEVLECLECFEQFRRHRDAQGVPHDVNFLWPGIIRVAVRRARVNRRTGHSVRLPGRRPGLVGGISCRRAVVPLLADVGDVHFRRGAVPGGVLAPILALVLPAGVTWRIPTRALL